MYKGILVTCIQDAVKHRWSVIAFEHHDDSLVRWLQEHGGVLKHILGVHILLCETRILWLPWGIIKDMEDHEC
jgi:hypothetical protein